MRPAPRLGLVHVSPVRLTALPDVRQDGLDKGDDGLRKQLLAHLKAFKMPLTSTQHAFNYI